MAKTDLFIVGVGGHRFTAADNLRVAPTYRARPGTSGTVLADGAVPPGDVKALAGKTGFSWATVRRAKDKIGIVARKLGMRGGWVWQLPEGAHSPAEESEGTHLSESEPLRDSSGEVSTFGDDVEVFE